MGSRLRPWLRGDSPVELGLSRLVFVNKLDRERASFRPDVGRAPGEVRCGYRTSRSLPIGEEAGFCGIADLLTDSAIRYDSGSPDHGPIPEELADVEHQVREQLIEGIVVGDDALMERYLEGEIPTQRGARGDPCLWGRRRRRVPRRLRVCGHRGRYRPARALLSEIARAWALPGRRKGGRETPNREVACDPAAQPLARVFKTISDPYVGHISLLQVHIRHHPS